MEIKITK